MARGHQFKDDDVVLTTASAVNTIPPGAYAPQVEVNLPETLEVVSGGEARFTASAFGQPTPTAAWEVSVADGPFTPIEGATDYTYVIDAVSTEDGNIYHCVFTNDSGSATTQGCRLEIPSEG